MLINYRKFYLMLIMSVTIYMKTLNVLSLEPGMSEMAIGKNELIFVVLHIDCSVASDLNALQNLLKMSPKFWAKIN